MGSEALIQLIVLLIAIVGVLVAIVGVGVTLAVMIQSSARESRSEMNRLQDRVTNLEGNLRDRIAWIEGLLGAFSSPPNQESVYRWRGLGQTEPEEED